MKKSMITLAIALIAMFSFHTAQAQNPHFTDVQVSNDGLTVTGKIAGLGNSSGLVTISYSGEATITKKCINNGGNEAVGQRETATLSASDSFQTARNGKVSFSFTLDPSEIGGDYSCTGAGLQVVLESVVNKYLEFETQFGGHSGNYTVE